MMSIPSESLFQHPARFDVNPRAPQIERGLRPLDVAFGGSRLSVPGGGAPVCTPLRPVIARSCTAKAPAPSVIVLSSPPAPAQTSSPSRYRDPPYLGAHGRLRGGYMSRV